MRQVTYFTNEDTPLDVDMESAWTEHSEVEQGEAEPPAETVDQSSMELVKRQMDDLSIESRPTLR